MTVMKFLPALLLVLLCVPSDAATVVVTVAEDESVASNVAAGDGIGAVGYPTVNPHFEYDITYPAQTVTYDTSLYKGVLWSGVYQRDASEFVRTRFYLKFELPSLAPNEYIASAELVGNYCDDLYPTEDGVHEIYYVPDDSWKAAPYQDDVNNIDQNDSSKGITWNNQPLLTPAGSPLGTFDAANYTPGTGSWISWDITPAVTDEYAADQVLSLMFKAEDETLGAANLNFEKFGEKDCACGTFYLSLDVQSAAVPEPSVWIGLLGAGAIGVLLAWRRRHAVAR